MGETCMQATLFVIHHRFEYSLRKITSEFFLSWFIYVTRCSSSVGTIPWLQTAPEMVPGIEHILFIEILFTLPLKLSVSGKEWALNTGKLPPGGLPRNSVVK